MPDPKQELTDLQHRLGYKSLNRIWGKPKILLGLGAATWRRQGHRSH
jgi:hypothetical protein